MCAVAAVWIGRSVHVQNGIDNQRRTNEQNSDTCALSYPNAHTQTHNLFFSCSFILVLFSFLFCMAIARGNSMWIIMQKADRIITIMFRESMSVRIYTHITDNWRWLFSFVGLNWWQLHTVQTNPHAWGPREKFAILSVFLWCTIAYSDLCYCHIVAN